MAEEKNLETRLKKWLESVGIYPLGVPKQKIVAPPVGYWCKRWGGGQFTKAGLPDMQIVVKGKNIDVELKATNGKPSVLQLHIIEQINACGGCALVVYPKDLEKLKKLVKEYINETENH